MKIPFVSEVMTPSPHVMGHDQPLRNAAQLMGDVGIRHLPVVMGHRFLGVISERDLDVARAIERELSLPLSLSDIFKRDAFTVPPDARLDQVVSQMAEQRVDYAVIVDAGEVAGIFTMVDACRYLADRLRSDRLRGED